MTRLAFAASLLLFTGAAWADEAATPKQDDATRAVATGNPTDLTRWQVQTALPDAGTAAPNQPGAQKKP